jgi:EAL domain-containing protein (putative c-di-GMP-specific phosphodiesterase class I)
VLNEACRHASGWAQQWPERRLYVAVNVSGRQLTSGDFVGVVSDALARSGLDPELLTLELTESTLIDDAVTVAPFLRELRALGVNLALDDFGTGYSSLTYLRTFPFNVIKIDRSFIRTISTDHDDTAIAAAVIGLAESLGLVVIAEGVEDHVQLAVLRQLTCHYIQGFLFAQPQPIETAPIFLDTPVLGFTTPDSPTPVSHVLWG